jgi:hypothetical protein
MKTGPMAIASSYVAPALAKLRMFVRNLGGIVTREAVGGINRARMKMGPIGGIESEENVWSENDEDILNGGLRLQHPYGATMTAEEL